MCEITHPLSGLPRSTLPCGAGLRWPTDTVAHLWGDSSVGKCLGIPKGRRNRLIETSHLFRRPSYIPLLLERFRAIFLLVSAEKGCFSQEIPIKKINGKALEITEKISRNNFNYRVRLFDPYS